MTNYAWFQCEPGKGIAILYDLLYNEPQKIMMLGPGCSTVTTTIAEAAKMWNLVVVRDCCADVFLLIALLFFPDVLWV